MRRLTVVLFLLLAACRQGGPLDLEELKGRARAGDADAGRELVRLLGEEGEGVNSKVYPAVLEMGERAVPFLLEEVGTDDRIRREHVVAALGNLKAKKAAEPIADILGDADLQRRYVAAWALGEIGDPATVPALVKALDDNDGEVRRHAVRALIRFGGAAVPPLVAYLPGATPRGGTGAVRALGDIGDPRAVEPLLAQVNGPVRQEVFLALGKLKDPRAEAALVAGLADPDWKIRMNAAMALGPLGSPGAVSALKKTLEDEVTVVREWSARSLEMITGSHVNYRNEKGEMVLPYSIYH
jgi:HEAT repeat protein